MKKLVRITTSLLIAITLLTAIVPTSAAASSRPAKVKGVVATANSKKKSIKLSWKRVKGATKYAIYKNTKRNFKKIKAVKVKKTQKTFKNLKLGKTYYFKIVALKKSKMSKATIKKVKLPKIKPTKKSPFESAKLIVNKQEIVDSNVKINKEEKYALIPFLAVSEKLKASVYDKDKTISYITPFRPFALDKSKSTLYTEPRNEYEENLFILPEGVTHPSYFLATPNDFIVDTDTARYFLVDILEAEINIDYENNIINISNLLEFDFMPCKLIVNGKDLTHLNLTVMDTKYKYAKIPLLAIAEELGAEVDWETEGTKAQITINYEVSTTTVLYFEPLKDTIYPVGDERYNLLDFIVGGWNNPPLSDGALVDDDYVTYTLYAHYFIREYLCGKITTDYENRIININTQYEEHENRVIKDGKVVGE